MTVVSEIACGLPRNDSEIAAYAAILRKAFLFPAEGEEAVFTAREGRENMWLVRRDGRVAGGLVMFRMGQWFGGRRVPMAGVRAVAIAPEARSGGLANTLLTHALAQLREEGVWLSTLYPATLPVYRRVGYELAGLKLEYRLPLASIGAQSGALAMREVVPGDRETLRRLQTTAASQGAGQLDRAEFFWNGLFEPRRDPCHGYLVEGPNGPEGYVFFAQIKGERRLYDLHVRDLIALTPGAGQRILRLLADHRSMADYALWQGGPAEPLCFLLPEPSVEVLKRGEWMLRLVDVREALLARGYPRWLKATLHLELRDESLPWNAGRCVLEVEDGHATVREGGSGALGLDVRGLAALYAGHMAPGELTATGLLAGGPVERAIAGAIFAGPAPWMPDGF